MMAVIVSLTAVSNAKGTFTKGTQLFKVGVGVNGNGIPVEVSYEKGVKNDFFRC
ncbi:MAG: hypothetical protein KBE91_11070 [Bacteroidia bacterium]|nr:hypothetical protein [Bacteroidia bacterium]